METLLSGIHTFGLGACHDELAGLIREKQAFLAHPTGNFLKYKQVL
jgi:hypothetical protein